MATSVRVGGASVVRMGEDKRSRPRSYPQEKCNGKARRRVWRMEVLMSTRAISAGLRSAVYATAFFAFWAWVALAFRGLDRSPMPAWCSALGVVLAVPGALLVLASMTRFALRGEGTPMPVDAPRRVVVDGPYRWVRNPMYVGGCVLLAAAGLYFRSPGMFACTIVFAIAASAFVHLYEEPVLRERFGAAYDEYRRRVPRWIPRHPSADR
jgi:protein-S-isoprenylcysteine O-methyltransferase Ste14